MSFDLPLCSNGRIKMGKTLINNENKEIKLKVQTKKITIEIPTETIINAFNDCYGEDCKIRNKRIFRETFANQVRDQLEFDVINDVFSYIIDDESCVKYIED
jgi:hypothetical protein